MANTKKDLDKSKKNIGGHKPFGVDIDPDKLNGRRKEIVKDFVKQIDNEIETSFRNGLRK